jgi:hypothetical protein
MALNGDCPKWVVTFSQKCCYNSSGDLGSAYIDLDVANLIINISKNDEKIPFKKSQNFLPFIFHLLILKIFKKLRKFSPKRRRQKKKKKLVAVH